MRNSVHSAGLDCTEVIDISQKPHSMQLRRSMAVYFAETPPSAGGVTFRPCRLPCTMQMRCFMTTLILYTLHMPKILVLVAFLVHDSFHQVSAHRHTDSLLWKPLAPAADHRGVPMSPAGAPSQPGKICSLDRLFCLQLAHALQPLSREPHWRGSLS